MQASLVRTTAFASAAVLILAGALAFQRPDPAPEVQTRPAPSPASDDPVQASGTPTPGETGEAAAAEASPYQPEPASVADLGVERRLRSGPEGPEAETTAVSPAASAEAPRRSGDGWLVAPGTSPTVGAGSLRRFTVEVEDATGLDPSAVAAEVEAILFDPRSWISTGRFAFERVADPSSAHVRVVVATPATVDRWCATVGLNTGGWLSCQVRQRAMLNLDRWRSGVAAFGGDVASYRAYLVNHEIGHVLGYRHVDCPAEGALAPVMMQQSKSVGACRPNGWVDPGGG